MNKVKIILRKTKTIGVSFLLFFLGAIVSTVSMPSPEGYSLALQEKNALTESIQEQKLELENKNKELDELLILKEDLKKKEGEALAKAEELAKAQELAKAEEEKKAKEEAEKLQGSINNSGTSTNTSTSGGSTKPSTSPKPGTSTKPESSGTTQNPITKPIGKMVWKTATGKKYHSINNCGKTNPAKATQVTQSAAEAAGLTPCSKCF